MTNRELLENYRYIVIEIDTLEKQCRFFDNFIGGPKPIRSVQLTGMPRGTNDPEAAILQRNDTNEFIDKIESKYAELREMVDSVERILDRIDDRRLRIIFRNYYALGMTDEVIGDQLELSRQHVNRLRNAYLETLE
jgi:DNA-directed RNA polymerase specialized sigma subunit